MNQPAAEIFLEACGASKPPPLEVVHQGRGVIVRQQITLPFVLVGRDQRADLRLDTKGVSHRHAFLQMVAGRWWWVDLDSRTGTWAVGNPSTSLPLLDRQGIRIGPYTVRLAAVASSSSGARDQDKARGGFANPDGSAPPVNPLSADSDDPSLLPRLALEFHGSKEGLRTWRMDRILALVGRSAICKVRLHSPLVSRTHSALVNTPFGLWVVDLLGREGTYVNGISIRWARLEPEDEIQIDQFRIRVRYLSTLPRSQVSMPLFAPANEEHSVEPRTVAGKEAKGQFHSLPSDSWERKQIENASPDHTIAPVEVGVSLTGSEATLMPLVKQFSMMQHQMFEQFQHTLLMMAQMFGNLQKEQMAVIRQELEQIQALTRQIHALPMEGSRTPLSPQPAILQAPHLDIPPPPPPSKPATPTAAKAETTPVPPKFPEGDVHAWLSQRLTALEEERQSRWQKVLSLITGK